MYTGTAVPNISDATTGLDVISFSNKLETARRDRVRSSRSANDLFMVTKRR